MCHYVREPIHTSVDVVVEQCDRLTSAHRHVEAIVKTAVYVGG